MAELNAALNLDTRGNGNINLSKYFISSSGDRTHNQSILKSHLVPLRHYWPQIGFIYLNINYSMLFIIFGAIVTLLDLGDYGFPLRKMLKSIVVFQCRGVSNYFPFRYNNKHCSEISTLNKTFYSCILYIKVQPNK